MSTAGSKRRLSQVMTKDARTKGILMALERYGDPSRRIALGADTVLTYQNWRGKESSLKSIPVREVCCHYGFLKASCHHDDAIKDSLAGLMEDLADDDPRNHDMHGGDEHRFAKETAELSRRLWGGVVAATEQNPFFTQMRSVQIPKLKMTDIPLVCSDLPRRFLCNEAIGDTGKKRVLTIADTRQRVIAGAAAIVLQAYMQKRWHRGVVGYRPGVSCATTLSALREAANRTQRSVIVFGDIATFFDRIPLVRLWEIVASELGITVNDPLIAYLKALLGTRSPDAADYVAGVGLPQGNPLSPILANMYAAKVFDREARHIGPTLRYADDFCILVKDVADGFAAVSHLQDHLRSANLGLQPEKCQIFDLVRNRCVAAVPTIPGHEVVQDAWNHCYLGVGLQWQQRAGDTGAQIYYHVTDSKLWAIAEGLRQTWIQTCFNVLIGNSKQRIRPVDAVKQAYVQSYNRIRGWLDYYGGVDWTTDQEGFFGATLWIAGLTGAGPIPHLRAAMAAKDINYQAVLDELLAKTVVATGELQPWLFFKAELLEGVEVPELPPGADFRRVDWDTYAAVIPEVARRLQPEVHRYRESYAKYFRSEIAARRDLGWRENADAMPPGTIRSDRGHWSDGIAESAGEAPGHEAAMPIDPGFGVVPMLATEAIIGTRPGRNPGKGVKGVIG